MIAQIEPSKAKDKRFTITMTDGKRINFGQKDPINGTYIDHKNNELRKQYLARHLANKKEKYLIDNLIPSPSLFSAYILWSYGNNKITTIKGNIDYLNSLLKARD